MNFAKFLRTPFFIKKETLAQVFLCETCKIFKNNFFDRTPPVAASGNVFVKPPAEVCSEMNH